jgi:hypothetical protein
LALVCARSISSNNGFAAHVRMYLIHNILKGLSL